VIYLETNDAGAFFRFTDTYPRMFGGQMWVAFDPPDADQVAAGRHPQRSRFRRARRESARQHRRQRPRPGGVSRSSVDFQRMRVDFTRMPGS